MRPPHRRPLVQPVRVRDPGPAAIDAMAVIYALSTLVLVLIALRFVNPTQLVSQVREDRG